jgi:glycine hydroxymethyltransferase
MDHLGNYFNKVPEQKRSKAAIAYLAALDHVGEHNPSVVEKIIHELKDQRSHLKLIASENYSSLAVQLAMGNLLTDKYAEGFPGRRFYAGCENVDFVEDLAVQELKALFGCEHAYVQPHSGADANLVAFWAILIQKVQAREVALLEKKTVDELTSDEYEKVRRLLVQQKMMGLSLSSGGHLTHGFRHNVSAKMMQAVTYDVNRETGLIDYADLQAQVKKEKPLILVAGYSSYSRLINFAKMREIADSVGAVLLVDMAHFAGLVAGKAICGEFDPIPYAHIVTSTTHKTLRGPRGGIVLCTNEFKDTINKGCPIILGGPLEHVIAAKAVAFKEAQTLDFQEYAKQIIKNAKQLSASLSSRGVHVVTGGTDNHLLVFNVTKTFGLTGRQAEMALTQALFTVNRNVVPFDENGAWHASGVRIGTPALTTLGMKEKEMEEIADCIVLLLKATKPLTAEKTSKVEIDPSVLESVIRRVEDLLKSFPLYPELVIDSMTACNAVL